MDDGVQCDLSRTSQASWNTPLNLVFSDLLNDFLELVGDADIRSLYDAFLPDF